MCIIILVFIVIGSIQVFHCEWIEISQPIRKSDEIIGNHSLMITNAELPSTFDYSTYKDFFSIIEPDIDLVKHVKPFHRNIGDNFTVENKSKKKDYHILMDNSADIYEHQSSPARIRKNQLLLDSSNASKVSVFSEFSETNDEFAKEPVKMDSFRIKLKNSNRNVHNKFDNPIENDKQEPLKNLRVNKLNERRPSENENRIVFNRVELKPFDFNGVLQFFTNMQQSFPMDSFSGIREKVTFLQNFKNTLIQNIEERFKMLWSASGHQVKPRTRRSPSNHGMDFPSSETALMTISFLTLAVFLIKLVLQVIHTIKSKHVGLQTMTPANESPIKIIKTNRNARKLSLSTADDLRAVTEAISSIEKNANVYT